MINRPQSRQFLLRSKLQYPQQARESVTGSGYLDKIRDQRSYSGNQKNVPNNINFARNTVGCPQTQNIRQRIDKEKTNANTIQYSYEYCNNTFKFVENKSDTRSADKNSKFTNHYYPESKNIVQLESFVKTLAQRVSALQNGNKFEDQKNAFNMKKMIETEILRNKSLEEKKLDHYYTKIEEKIKQIEQIKAEIQESKSLNSCNFDKIELEEYLNERFTKAQLIFQQKIQDESKKIANDFINIYEGYKSSTQNSNKIFEEKLKVIESIISEKAGKKQQKLGIPIGLLELNISLHKLICMHNKAKQNSSANKENQINRYIHEKTPNKDHSENITQIYKIDKDGFLMDSNNHYILDPRNYMIRIDDEMLNKLNKIGVLTEKVDNIFEK